MLKVLDQIYVQRVPAIKVTTSNGSAPAPGVDLISLTIGNANQLLALATDVSGNVIWYYDYDSSLGIPQPMKLLPNGHMLLVLYTAGSAGGTLREIDLAGNVIKEFDYNSLAQKLQQAGYNIQVFLNRPRFRSASQRASASIDQQPANVQ